MKELSSEKRAQLAFARIDFYSQHKIAKAQGGNAERLQPRVRRATNFIIPRYFFKKEKLKEK